jgi:hypothetical protein
VSLPVSQHGQIIGYNLGLRKKYPPTVELTVFRCDGLRIILPEACTPLMMSSFPTGGSLHTNHNAPYEIPDFDVRHCDVPALL